MPEMTVWIAFVIAVLAMQTVPGPDMMLLNGTVALASGWAGKTGWRANKRSSNGSSAWSAAC